jgi:hypothetical protein
VCLDMLLGHLLRGANIVYATHPYFGGGRTTVAMWDKYFGNASKMVPVVADEWGEYDLDPSKGGECVTGAKSIVPQFLSYLMSNDIGVIGFSLWPGTLIRGWSFTTPTDFDQPSYTCRATQFPNLDPQAQGAGAMLRDHLARVVRP